MHFQALFLLAVAAMVMAQESDINEDDLPWQCQDNSDCVNFLDDVSDCGPISPPFSEDSDFQDCICYDNKARADLSGCIQCTYAYKTGGDIETIYDICATY